MSRSDMTFLRSALAARAAELAVTLLGAPSMTGKRELRFGRQGSVAVVVSGPKAGMWHDHEAGTGGDMLALIMRERRGSGSPSVPFLEAVRYAEQFIGHASRERMLVPRTAAPADDDADAERNRLVALNIWAEAVPIAGTTAAEYLAGRGILKLPPGVDDNVLRFHGSCPYTGGRRPCMVALMRDALTDKPRAIQRTALPYPDKPKRLTLGPKGGCAIKLSADPDVANRLTVGEGCETVLAGMTLGYAPAWALGDAGELKQFPVLAGIDTLTILVDHDAAGETAARECSGRWTGAGAEVFRIVPRRPKADINDLITDRGGRERSAPAPVRGAA